LGIEHVRTFLPSGLFLLIGAAGAATDQLGDWPISSPAREGLNPAGLAQLDAHIQAQLPHVRSLLIARHGRLVFEKYFGDASQEGLQNLQSMTKSVSSALVGISLKKGLILSLDRKALDYFPEYRDAITDPRAADITIRNLLTMSSGIGEMQLSFDKKLANPIPEILRQRLVFAPGQGFQYSSAAAHLLGGVLRKATGKCPLEFAELDLFSRLGMGRVVWYADNAGLQSGGLSGLFRSRDILKLGELYLRRGRWGGVELISSSYIEASVKIQNTGEFFGEPARYGYMWWITTIAGYEGFYARGYGGQYMMVLPKADLVLLCTSDWRQPEYPEHFALIGEYILPSIVHLDGDGPASGR
jgi:CubicO group peptidase (beta-lactamase class C family)